MAALKETEYASLWLRLIAFILDSLVILSLALAASDLSRYLPLVLSRPWTTTSLAYISFGAFLGVGVGVGLALCAGFWVWRGQSPGQITFRLRVVRSQGMALTWGWALLRFLGYFLAAAPLFMGFLWAAFDSRRQGLHDKLADTVVISLPPPQPGTKGSLGKEL